MKKCFKLKVKEGDETIAEGFGNLDDLDTFWKNVRRKLR